MPKIDHEKQTKFEIGKKGKAHNDYVERKEYSPNRKKDKGSPSLLNVSSMQLNISSKTARRYKEIEKKRREAK